MIKSRLKTYLIIIGIILACVFTAVLAYNNRVSADEGEWWESYTYSFDETNHTVTLTNYRGTDTEIVVEPIVTKDGTDYDVILNGKIFYGTYEKSADYTSIVIKDGVKAGTSCEDMFYYCRKLTTLDISHLDTSNVTTMRGMFRLLRFNRIRY